MAKLETMGYLCTDNFSGRIPREDLVIKQVKEKIDFENINAEVSIDKIREFAIKNNLSFFNFINVEKEKIEMVFVNILNKNKVLFTLTTESNLVYNKIFLLETEVQPLEILKLNEVLKKTLCNKNVIILNEVLKIFEKYSKQNYFYIIENIFNGNIVESMKKSFFETCNLYNFSIEDLSVNNDKKSLQVIQKGNMKHNIAFCICNKNNFYGIIGGIKWRNF